MLGSFRRRGVLSNERNGVHHPRGAEGERPPVDGRTIPQRTDQLAAVYAAADTTLPPRSDRRMPSPVAEATTRPTAETWSHERG